MSANITIARPYAKAIFKHALVTNRLKVWYYILYNLSLAVANKKVVAFITNPVVTEKQQCELLLSIFNQLEKSAELTLKNLLALLAHNKRLLILTDLVILFKFYADDYEKQLIIKVNSFAELTSAQQQQLKLAMHKRLGREITLNITIDKSILGGVIIQADDLVIDLSVRGKLNKLKTCLGSK